MEAHDNLKVSGLVNDLRIPDDLILSNCTMIDVLHLKNGDLMVEELIVNVKLNELPLGPLFNFTLNANPYRATNLNVEGE